MAEGLKGAHVDPLRRSAPDVASLARMVAPAQFDVDVLRSQTRHGRHRCRLVRTLRIDDGHT